MRRRAFLAAVLSSAPVSVAMAGDEPKWASEEPRRKRPVMVAAAVDGFDKPVRFAVGHIECEVSAKDTDGAMCVVEALTSAADRPARHLHHDQDEWFYVLEGEYDFEVGRPLLFLEAAYAIARALAVAAARKDEADELDLQKIKDQIDGLATWSDRIADMATKARTIQNSGRLIEQCALELKQDLDAKVAAVLKALQRAPST